MKNMLYIENVRAEVHTKAVSLYSKNGNRESCAEGQVILKWLFVGWALADH